MTRFSWWRRDAATGPTGPILRKTGVPALAGAVVGAEGVRWIGAEGLRRCGGDDRVTLDDRWHLGSNAKALTAALYARLVEQGKAGWGATLPELFPDVPVHAAWSEATVEKLMSHRAGISDQGVIGSDWLMARHRDDRPPAVQRMELARAILSAPPRAKAGAFEYANASFVLLGAAVERLVDAAWEDAIDAGLFRPLGMASAGFAAPRGAEPWGHDDSGQGYDPAGLADNPAVLAPAAGVHATLADYAGFLRLFLDRGGGYVQPDTLSHLLTPASGAGPSYSGGWIAEKPRWGGGVVFGHEGSNTLWYAMALVAPDRGW